MTTNPMQSAHAALRCRARSKRTGQPCRAPAVRGWEVCRMHGARGGAPEGKGNGAYRFGSYTRASVANAAYIRLLARMVRETLGKLDGEVL